MKRIKFMVFMFFLVFLNCACAENMTEYFEYERIDDNTCMIENLTIEGQIYLERNIKVK